MAKPAICDIDITIGKQIQRRRRELGLSADDLSECINVSQQQFSRYERAQSKITAAQLKRVADATQTDISWFLLGAENSQPIKAIQAIAEDNSYYQSFESNELLNRFNQLWQTFNLEQQRTLIRMLDTFNQSR